ncbi:MAG: serine hydrolase [Bacteroidota bacterium]
MRAFIILFFSISLFQIHGQDLYFPPVFGDDWESIDPAELNWCPDSLLALEAFLDEQNTKAFIVLKDGRIALEWYFDEFEQDSLWYWASAGKSLTAFMVGLAQEDGFLDIASPSSEYLGGAGWTSAGLTEESQITIWHQLTMTSGLDDGVANPDCWESSCLQYLSNAGTRWAYHNAPYTLLDSVISTATNQSLNGYIFNRLSLSTGIFGAFVPIEYNNVFFSTARVMARFGLLNLANGNWDGEAIMSDANYFSQMTSSSQDLNKSYGFLWWLNGQGEHMIPQTQFVFNGDLIPSAPSDLYAAMGLNEQRTYVIPSQNLVVVRMGESTGSGLLALSSFDDQLWGRISNLACEPIGIQSLDFSSTVIGPNPFQSQLHINALQRINKIQVFDLVGRSQGIFFENILDLEHLDNGTYLVKVEFANGDIHCKKVIKN